ncbi:hypothetical protein Mapa_000781 [Marchantia paleacea]|nr:hypothetical protein Mapa_000781 [Marchantia paleacea]
MTRYPKLKPTVYLSRGAIHPIYAQMVAFVLSLDYLRNWTSIAVIDVHDFDHTSYEVFHLFMMSRVAYQPREQAKVLHFRYRIRRPVELIANLYAVCSLLRLDDVVEREMRYVSFSNDVQQLDSVSADTRVLIRGRSVP